MIKALVHLFVMRRNAITQGISYRSTSDINEMNRRVKLSHLNSPWAYNRPGLADIEFVDWEGPEDDYELDYDVKGLVLVEPVASEPEDPWAPENWGWVEADLEYLSNPDIDLVETEEN